MHLSELWYGDSAGAKTARVLLLPASWLYAAGWNVYALIYRIGLKQPKRSHVPVLCIGNLTVGGSGKTPLTIFVANMLCQAGREVVISCSGYGSRAQESATRTPEGQLSATEWGDEAALIRDNVDVPLIVGRNRVRAAEICQREFPNSVLLLDDGFQHLPLKKHISVVLDEPSSNRSCLPAGPYREPVSHRRYADMVMPGKFEMMRLPLALEDAHGRSQPVPETANLLCALGSPDRFVQAVRTAGTHVNRIVLKPDHDPLQAGNLFAHFSPEQPLIVTEKDWVKLRERADLESRNILIAQHSVRVLPEDEFRTWLLGRLDEVIAQRT